jgi:hypothetical protein
LVAMPLFPSILLTCVVITYTLAHVNIYKGNVTWPGFMPCLVTAIWRQPTVYRLMGFCGSTLSNRYRTFFFYFIHVMEVAVYNIELGRYSPLTLSAHSCFSFELFSRLCSSLLGEVELMETAVLYWNTFCNSLKWSLIDQWNCQIE